MDSITSGPGHDSLSLRAIKTQSMGWVENYVIVELKEGSRVEWEVNLP